MKNKTCSFFGHRNTLLGEKQIDALTNCIELLVKKFNVSVFLFGSRSKFDDTCHQIVTNLKSAYPFIIRKRYTCKSETCILESELRYWEKTYCDCTKEDVVLLGVEEEVSHKRKQNSGKASYVERNQAMIDDSDYCIFYYDKEYKPKKRKCSKKSLTYYQPKSGTALAYAYAKRKKKIIINVFDNSSQ